MAALVYRNRLGELVDVPSVTATEAKKDFADVIERANTDGAVAITRHGRHRAVLMSYAEFEALTGPGAAALDDLVREFDDALLTRMQTPAAKKALAAAFDATPARLGAAAVRAAARRRR